MQSRNINSSVDTLRSTIEPPPDNIVTASFQELISLGAIREDGMFTRTDHIYDLITFGLKRSSGSLTDVGIALCSIPVEPRVALLLVNGSFLGCLGPLLTFAASIESRTIFSAGCEPSSASVRGIIGRLPFSDFDAIVSVRNKYQSTLQKQSKAAAHKYIDSVHVSSHALDIIEQQRRHLLQAMLGSGLACSDSFDDLNEVARACLVASFWPSVGIVSDASGSTPRCTCAQGSASIQQSCVLVGANLPNRAIFTYTDAMASANGKVSRFSPIRLVFFGVFRYHDWTANQVSLSGITRVSPQAVLLFGKDWTFDTVSSIGKFFII